MKLFRAFEFIGTSFGKLLLAIALAVAALLAVPYLALVAFLSEIKGG